MDSIIDSAKQAMAQTAAAALAKDGLLELVLGAIAEKRLLAKPRIGPGKRSTFTGESVITGHRFDIHRDGKVVKVTSMSGYTPKVAAECADMRALRAQRGVGSVRKIKRHAEATA